MKELTVYENETNTDDIELLSAIYLVESNAYDIIPNIMALYEEFCNSWLSFAREFLEVNQEVYALTDEELNNIEEKLGDFDLELPSFERFRNLINILNLTYESEGDVFNKGAMESW